MVNSEYRFPLKDCGNDKWGLREFNLNKVCFTMNILQVLPALEAGGVETGTLDLAKELAKAGHKAVVVSSGGSLVSKLEALSVKHYTLAVHKKSLFVMFKLVSELREIINREDIDLVHARSRVPAWISFFALQKTRAEFVTTCHGYYSNHFFSKVMGFGKVVIAISNTIAQHMRRDFKVPEHKIRLIYRGLDLEKFKFRGFFVKNNAKEKIIGIVGRITQIKGHTYLFKAMPRILKEFPNAKIIVIGAAAKNKQNYFKQLCALIAGLNLNNKIEFLSNAQNIPGILSKLDLLVLPSTYLEGFGRVIIEAGAVGVPVIASKIGGITEIIEHNHNGLLVSPADVYGLECEIIRILKEPGLARKLAANLKNDVQERFSLNTLADKTIAVYREVLENKRILVIKFGSLGDVILITPALRALRAKFPKAEIEVLVLDKFKDVLLGCPDINQLICLKNKGLIEVFAKTLLLRKKKFDLIIDFQNNKLSHILGFLCGAEKHLGYRNKKFGFLLKSGIIDKMSNVGPITHQFQLLKFLNINLVDKKLKLQVGEQKKKEVIKLLESYSFSLKYPLIGINAFASLRWQSKAWLIERYAGVADMLAREFNAQIVFTGILEHKEKIANIISLMRSKAINCAGQTSLRQLCALIDLCAVFLSVDSAPLHIAAAVETPFVALFGATNPQKHLPYAEKFVLIKKETECSPCYKSFCTRKDCMRSISINEVFRAISTLLDGKKR